MSVSVKHSESPLKKPCRQRRLEAIAARWDKRAATWDQSLDNPDCHFNEDDAYNRFLREARRVVAERKKFCARHGLIDAGCGTGLVMAELIAAFAWGLGLDISPRMIALAAAKKIKGARFHAADCFQFARLRSKAGAVVSRGVLLSHYGPALGLVLLAGVRKCLVPGGFALFDFLNEDARLTHWHSPPDKIYFTSAQVSNLAREAGFAKVTIRGARQRRVLLLLAEVE